MAHDSATQGTWRSAVLSGARGTVTGANNLMTLVRRRHRVDPGGGPVRLNLGSALAVAHGWTHVDSSPNAMFAGRSWQLQALAYRFTGSNAYFDFDDYRRRLNEFRIIHHDLADGIPFPDTSVDFVYSSHFLEHLDREAGLHLLRDSYRALRVGGIVRVCVPDLQKAVQFYLDGDREWFLAYFFTDGRLDRHRHRFMYDFDALSQALSSAGFVNVTRCQFRVGRTPDLDQLDNRRDETLYVEAVCP